jgi:hypothetical protein
MVQMFVTEISILAFGTSLTFFSQLKHRKPFFIVEKKGHCIVLLMQKILKKSQFENNKNCIDNIIT